MNVSICKIQIEKLWLDYLLRIVYKIPDGAYALKSGGNCAEDVLGHITSTYFSPSLDKPIAMALLKNGKSLKGQEVDIPLESGNKLREIVVDPQFYDIEGKRQNV